MFLKSDEKLVFLICSVVCTSNGKLMVVHYVSDGESLEVHYHNINKGGEAPNSLSWLEDFPIGM